jgi:hypothetical protein
LDEAGALVAVQPDDDTIDEDVDRFRTFLDEVDPAEFENRRAPGEPPDQAGT